MLPCEPGPCHLSNAFHFAPRAPNMLCPPQIHAPSSSASSSRGRCVHFVKVDYAPLCIELHNCFPRSCNSFEANGLHLFYFLLLHNTVFAKLFRNFISFYPVKGFLHIYEIDKHLCNFINSNTNGFSGIPSTMYYSYNDNRANSVQAIVNLLTNYFLLVYSTDKTCNTSFSVWCDIIDIKQI